MHTEHLQNVGFGRVLVGWVVAIAATSFVLLVLAAFDALPLTSDEAWWSVLAAGFGFLAGGFYAGFRAMQAPILHGVSIALMSLLAWLLLNLIVFGLAGHESWQGLTPTLTLIIMLVMIVTSVVGALLGYNLAVVGKPSLSEHEPL
jgi:hypothetical protein